MLGPGMTDMVPITTTPALMLTAGEVRDCTQGALLPPTRGFT